MQPSTDVLSWTNRDPRESQLFNSWGVLYRFSTVVNPSGQSTTTLWRAVRTNKEDRVAKLEWAANGGLGRAVIGKNAVPMADLVRPDPRCPGARMFNAPDGLSYCWRPNAGSPDVVRANGMHKLEDSAGNTVAIFRPTRPTRYQIGDVYGELHFLRNAGAATITHPPIMDTVTVTAMLYRFCQAFGL
ncbi:hypothetical protein F5141DRAFT_1064820 [Pisolithus sp. B1]|nr:hypothetical protein F5141DRAFT_1064820 [Pisolithus sp. B1]